MIAGIDGGGTSTKLELRSDTNELISREAFGAFNISAIGENAFRRLMREIASSVRVSAITRLCIGGAGVSYAGLEDIIRDELGREGFTGRLALCTDFEIALRGAINGPGCVLIAGTGSVGFGINSQGEKARVGGYGHIIDDAGSGYALGRDALSAIVQMGDGRLQKTPLWEAVFAQLEISTIPELLSFVYYQGIDKSSIAALSASVLSCAAAGDALSLSILQRNAQELKRIIVSLTHRLNLSEPKTALLGGLLANDTLYRKVVAQALQGTAQPVLPLHDALWGAAQMAYEMQ